MFVGVMWGYLFPGIRGVIDYFHVGTTNVKVLTLSLVRDWIIGRVFTFYCLSVASPLFLNEAS